MKSIRGKILLCMSLTVLIALCVLGGTSVYLNYSSSKDLLGQTMKETANVAAERVSQELSVYRNIAWETGCTARLANPDLSVESKQAIIDEKVSSHGFRRGNIIGSDGISIFDGNDYSDREYYQQAMTGTTYVSEPLISKVTNELSIMVAAPLWEDGVADTNVIGVVYFVPTESFLNDIVSQIHISDNSAAYAINAEGVTIADNTLETITTQNIEEEAKTDDSLKELAAIHEKMRSGENGFGSYSINGTQKFSAYAPIAGTDGWSIGVTAPQSDFMNSTYVSIIITAVLLVLSAIITYIIAYMLASKIGRPIKTCALRLQGLSEGDLSSDIPQVKSKDETGVLADATASIVSNIREIIKDIDWGLGQMADGNFKIDSQQQDLYVGDFKSLAVSMYKLLEGLTSTLLQIDTSAEQVASGAEQVSSGAQALSQGATQQAASVEELAATIAAISEKVRASAESADETNRQTEKLSSEIIQSNHRMQEMLSAMSDISNSSNEIGKIVKTIEDIAFQTNILALNAAVEAARAGTAGKGFAVVADEVRNLAMKSAEASKNTTTLIENTMQAIANGTKIANETADSLQSVVGDVESVANTMNVISSASDEEAESIRQVTEGIDQISSVVQTNSATAEESAAASEELTGQSQLLKELVGRFQLVKPSESVQHGGNITV